MGLPDVPNGGVPASKHLLFNALEVALRMHFDDPVVDITHCGSTELRIRVGQDDRGPKYYRVKVIEES